ncbi:hypothetical protein GW915_11400 [bacterium]|nr:hypothetical protein [bacterium]
MKKFSIASFVVLAAFAAKANALPDLPVDEPTKVERVMSVTNVFVSSRMDRDDASVFISGQFPNSCYQWSRATVNELEEDKSAQNMHVLRAYANVSQGMCLQVITPFTREVSIGALGDGQHTIRVLNGDGTYQQLIVDIR